MYTRFCFIYVQYIYVDYYTFQDKILVSAGRAENIQITNDGATILKSVGVDNPAAKVLVGKYKTSLSIIYALYNQKNASSAIFFAANCSTINQFYCLKARYLG